MKFEREARTTVRTYQSEYWTAGVVLRQELAYLPWRKAEEHHASMSRAGCLGKGKGRGLKAQPSRSMVARNLYGDGARSFEREKIPAYEKKTIKRMRSKNLRNQKKRKEKDNSLANGT